jgi:calmodulin
MEATTLENLSKDELIHYQELFSIFDKEDSGHIPTTQFPIFVRGLGHCPTEAELKEMKTTLDPSNDGKIPFATIINFLLKRPKEQSIEEEIMEAFEALQSETGSLTDGEKTYKMSVKEAKKFLMDFGEALTETEA